MSKNVKFTIECEIPERWVPEFLGLLKTMESCGRVGASRKLIFYSDGDGDYRPKFKFSDDLCKLVKFPKWKNDTATFDAG